jgi:hypothetical protein
MNIVQKSPEVHLRDYVGSYDYLLGDRKAVGVSADPSLLDIKRTGM